MRACLMNRHKAQYVASFQAFFPLVSVVQSKHERRNLKPRMNVFYL